MRVWIFLFLTAYAGLSFAHNMSEETKKNKIQSALFNFSNKITHNDIQISAAPLAADFELQYSRFFESGDKTLEDFEVEFENEDSRFKIQCDFLSGEYGRKKAIYFIVYRNCSLLDLESYKEKEIKLNTQFWNDWKY